MSSGRTSRRRRRTRSPTSPHDTTSAASPVIACGPRAAPEGRRRGVATLEEVTDRRREPLDALRDAIEELAALGLVEVDDVVEPERLRRVVPVPQERSTWRSRTDRRSSGVASIHRHAPSSSSTSTHAWASSWVNCR